VTGRHGGETARLLGPADHTALAELFAALDTERFHPHGFTPGDALRIAAYQGKDVYAVLEKDGRFVAYGILRGWEDGFAVPSLGIAVRTDEQGRGHGRRMMEWLAGEAGRRGARRIRLRVHPDNAAARRLYESVGYRYDGEERGELVMVVDL
jgi:ribosomal protein S18 acetylase RimI-like enzyme